MLYDYGCDNCSSKIEVSHPMSEEPNIKCETCGSLMHKIISGGSGTILKGGGWSSDIKMKQDLTKKNNGAGKKMKDHQQPVRCLDDLKKLKGFQ